MVSQLTLQLIQLQWVMVVLVLLMLDNKVIMVHLLFLVQLHLLVEVVAVDINKMVLVVDQEEVEVLNQAVQTKVMVIVHP